MAQVLLHRSHVRIAVDLGQMEAMAHSRLVGGVYSGMRGSDYVLAPPTSLCGYYRMGMGFPFHRSPHFHSGPDALLFRLSHPHGLMLRFMGKDLLKLHRPGNIKTNWESPRSSGGHDKMF